MSPDYREEAIHHIHARTAFENFSEVELCQGVADENGRVLVQRRGGPQELHCRPNRGTFAEALTQAVFDDERRFYVFLASKGLIGLLVSTEPEPAPPPDQLQLLTLVSRLRQGSAVAIPTADSLYEVRIFRGGTQNE